MASTFSSGGSITSTNRDSKGNVGKWNQRPDGSWVFVAKTKPADNTPAIGPDIPAPKAPTYAPAASPAAAAPADPNAWWQDSVYNSQVGPGGSIQSGVNNLSAYLNNQAKQYSADLGVNITGDVTGGNAQYSIDPNVDVTNPFSRAALLKQSYQQQQAGNKNRAAAAGQYNSGSLQNAQNRAGQGYLQGQDSLTKQAQADFSGLYGQYLSAQQSAKQAEIDAANQAYGRNQNNPAAPGSPAAAPTPAAPTSPALTARRVAKTVNGVRYYLTASGKLAPIPKGAPIIG